MKKTGQGNSSWAAKLAESTAHVADRKFYLEAKNYWSIPPLILHCLQSCERNYQVTCKAKFPFKVIRFGVENDQSLEHHTRIMFGSLTKCPHMLGDFNRMRITFTLESEEFLLYFEDSKSSLDVKVRLNGSLYMCPVIGWRPV